MGRGLVFEFLAPGSPAVEAMQLVLAYVYFVVATGHCLLPVHLYCGECTFVPPYL